MKARAFFALLLLGILGASAAWRWHERTRRDRLRITFFDVGQGDSALIEFPGGTTWLVDAGGGFGDFDAGERTLFPELARLGILRLDVAFLTHPDSDHALGFRGLFHTLTIDEFWLSHAVRVSGNPLLGRLLTLAKDRTRVRDFAVPEVENLGGARAQILPMHAGDDTNDEPLLLRLEYGGCAAFFDADAEAPAEARVVGLNLAPVDLLKVGHHGSKTSSNAGFLRALAPRWAVISVGEGNVYRHPHPLAIERLRHARAVLLRTDFHGYVRFTFADGKARCETAEGACGEERCRAARVIMK